MPDTLSGNAATPAPQQYTLEELLAFDLGDLEHLDAQRLRVSAPHIVATFLERYDVDGKRRVLRLLDESTAMEILAQMDSEDTAEVVGAMREWRALKILESMDPDDAADVVGDLEEDDRERLMGKLTAETAKTVRELLSYDEDTAGGVMNPAVTKLRVDRTVDQAIAEIREIAANDEHAAHGAYIYAVDDQGCLVGVLSLRELILAQPSQTIGQIAQTTLKGVCHVNDDRELVAQTLADLDLSALPVVDSEGRLLGVVTYDDVIDILQDEATEDLQILVGAGKNESIRDSIGYSVSRRGPWLIVNLMTAFMAASVVAWFEPQIAQFTLLAVFLPVIGNLGGNAGAQTLAVAIRSLATGELQPTDSLTVCLTEALKGLIGGLMVGVVAGAITWVATGQAIFSAVVLLSCLLNMALGGLIGALLPLLLKKMHCDPAQSASIFLTACTDMIGFLILLSLGTWLLL